MLRLSIAVACSGSRVASHSRICRRRLGGHLQAARRMSISAPFVHVSCTAIDRCVASVQPNRLIAAAACACIFHRCEYRSNGLREVVLWPRGPRACMSVALALPLPAALNDVWWTGGMSAWAWCLVAMHFLAAEADWRCEWACGHHHRFTAVCSDAWLCLAAGFCAMEHCVRRWQSCADVRAP